MFKRLKGMFRDLVMSMRGYKRTHGKDVRGRVYSPKVTPSNARVMMLNGQLEATAKVLRKDGTIEIYKNGRQDVTIIKPDGTTIVKRNGKVSRAQSVIKTVKEKLLRLFNK